MKNMLMDWQMGEIVSYDIGVVKGKGRIVGIASTPCFSIGASMIIEDLSGNVPTEDYPFSHFTIFEVYLKKVQASITSDGATVK